MKSLSKKITIIFFSLTLVTLALVQFSSYYLTKEIIEEENMTELKLLGEEIHTIVDTTIDNSIESYLKGIGDTVLTSIEGFYENYEDGRYDRATLDVLINQYLSNIKIGKSGYAYIVDNEGNYIYHPTEQGKNVASKSYIKESLEIKEGFISYESTNADAFGNNEKNAYVKYFDKLDYVINLSAYKSDFMFLLNQERIEKKINSLEIGSGLAYVVDDNGKLVFHPYLKDESLIEHMDIEDYNQLISKENEFYTYDLKDQGEIKKRVSYVTSYPFLNWKLIYAIDQDEMFYEVKAMQNKLLVLSAMLLLIVYVVSVFIGNNIANPIKKLSRKIELFSKGSFDVSFATNRVDEIGHLSQSLDEYKLKLGMLLKDMKNLVDNVVSENELFMLVLDNIALGEDSNGYHRLEEKNPKGMKQLVDNILNILDGVRNQAASAEESLASLEEVAASSQNVTEKVKSNVKNLDKTLRVTAKCKEDITAMKKTMNSVESAVETTETEVNRLASISMEISTILTAITSISEQTNLLALNAAIEAARAGEAGRGFSVVADEIRKLAEKTNAETAKIDQLISTVQSGVDNVKTSMVDVSSRVDSSMETVDILDQQIDKINKYTNRNNADIAEVAGAVEEQQVATEEIAGAVSSITENSIEIEGSMSDNSQLADSVKSILSNNQNKVKGLNKSLQKLNSDLSFFQV